MNIAVIGLGSMGKRRIRLIREMYPDLNIIGIDVRGDRREEIALQFSIRCYESMKHCNVSINCVFVCTSPLSHDVIIYDALNRGCHVFTELNLTCNGYNENMILAKEKGLKLFLSSTFLYREEIKFIRKKIDNRKQWNYIYHIGQYLPNWHPWENYQDFFLGEKRTNGCREIMALELPWLIETFGEAIDVNVRSDKMTGLNIDYKDNFMVHLTHRNKSKGCLIVDVVSPVAVRKLEVYSEGYYLSWDGTPDSLVEYDSEKKRAITVQLAEETEHIEGYSDFIVENAYKNEIKEFFDIVLNDKEPLYGFEKDKTILELIDKIGA